MIPSCNVENMHICEVVVIIINYNIGMVSSILNHLFVTITSSRQYKWIDKVRYIFSSIDLLHSSIVNGKNL